MITGVARSTTPLWNVAAWGWVCQGETRHGLTTVSTWTRDDQVLVLVFLGESDVQAAVLDGASLTPEQITEQVCDGESAVDMADMFDRARHHLESREGRVDTELAGLFEAAWKLAQPRPDHLAGEPPLLPLRLRSRLWNLALAILSTPGA
jgi:hypothetical protein